MKNFRFAKLSERWFVDVPYSGSIGDLEMIDGADTFLECYSNGNKEVNVYIIDNEKDYEANEYLYGTHVTLKKKCQDNSGTTYECHDGRYRGDIWLCKVFNMLIGESPETLEVIVLEQSSWK